MISIIKSEWHQVERRYELDFDHDLLSEIYPDKDEDEIEQTLTDLESGDIVAEDVINDAYEQGVDLEWYWLDEDDWWTDRKGGYEVTYQVNSPTNIPMSWTDDDHEKMHAALAETFLSNTDELAEDFNDESIDNNDSDK